MLLTIYGNVVYTVEYAGGNPSAGWFDGRGTNVYFDNLNCVAGDSMGNLYVDECGSTLRVIN
jgi:hypothetical protein